ncbi:hypothetical protein C1H46_042733 [Malus baccata]|uniref:Uncharacterized protein n=1 Tax=Malus baccata TaxID=106549 RepID=A0A540KBX3_MALBA|nr:hypothetical protein C1H46_042733 [Malus baccata]
MVASSDWVILLRKLQLLAQKLTQNLAFVYAHRLACPKEILVASSNCHSKQFAQYPDRINIHSFKKMFQSMQSETAFLKFDQIWRVVKETLYLELFSTTFPTTPVHYPSL